KSDAQCQAANRATRAYQKSKGNPQQNDDWRDEWEGQLLVPLHREPGHVKAGLLEVMDVLAQLAPVHLIVLAHLPVEIAWGFTQLLQRVVLKGNVAGDRRAVKVAHPAGFEQPGVAFRFPLGAVGEDAAAHLKISGVELKHVESAERRYLSQSQPSGMIASLRALGHQVMVIDPEAAYYELNDAHWLTSLNLVVARGRSWAVLCLLNWAEARGIPTVNQRAAIAAVHNKAEMAVALTSADVPTPLTLLGPTHNLARGTDARVYPLVIKPVFGANGRGLHLVTN